MTTVTKPAMMIWQQWLAAARLPLVLLLLLANVPLSQAATSTETHAASKAAATEPVPLALPNDPNVTCGKDVFLRLTATYTCPWEHYPANNPDAGCCEGLAIYFGHEATKPSKHCLCVPAVWARLTKEQEYHDLPLERILKYCNHAGQHMIPFYQAGAGYCNGTKDDEYARADYDAHYHEPKVQASFSNWASRLHHSWIMHLSFVSSVVSVPGFLLFLWPFVFDAYFTAKDAVMGRVHQTTLGTK